jgi:hypothetical protein
MKVPRTALTLIVLVLLGSCVSGVQLRAKYVEDTSEISGKYSLILYGGGSYEELDTIAVLDLEGDGYEVSPYAPEFKYKVLKGLEAETAIGKAGHFVSLHPEFMRAYVSEIMDESGSTIGYEFRPLYLPFNYGISDLLYVNYLLEEGGTGPMRKVRLVVRVKPVVEEIERARERDGIH